MPNPEQAELLSTCFLQGAPGVAAYRSWRKTVDIDRLDMGSVRLLPLLVERLRKEGISDTDFGRFVGVQRRGWARNQLLMHGASKAAHSLLNAEIPVLALKGLVLAVNYYASPSMRPMADADLMVPRSAAETALTVLEANNWVAEVGGARARTPAGYARFHAASLSHADNQEVLLDLHWRLLWPQFNKDAMQALWAKAVPFNLMGAEILQPGPADMLLHVCAHGLCWSGVPPIRWVADALTILRLEAIDWDHLLAQSDLLGQAEYLLIAFPYLVSQFDAPIPQQIIEALEKQPSSSINRLIFRTMMHAPDRRRISDTLRLHVHIARNGIDGMPPPLKYLHYFNNLRGERGPFEISAWLWRRRHALRRGF